MSENNSHKKDPRDIERRPPELMSNRRSSSGQSNRRSASEQNERRSVELKTDNTKSNAGNQETVQKKAVEPKSSQNRTSNPSSDRKAGKSTGVVQNPTDHKAVSRSAENENKRELSEQEKRLENRKKAILRRSKKREYSLQCFNIAVIIAIMAFITLFINFGERPKVDEDERRELAAIPEFTWKGYFDGSFTGGVSAWFNDAVPGRGGFKNFIALFRSKLGIPYDDGVVIIGPIQGGEDDPNESSDVTPPSSVTSTPTDPMDSNTQQPDTSSGSTPPSSSTSTGKPVVQPPDGDGDMSGTVLVMPNGQGFSIFYGSMKGGSEYAEYINELKARVGSDVNVYSMVVPTSGAYYLPEKYQKGSEWDNIENINSNLVGITPIDAYSALAAHVNEYIYFRTDHHWTQLGAYYAAEEFAKVAGVPFAPLSSYTRQDREGMLGSLWGYSKNHPNMKKNPDTFTFYKPTNEYTVTVYSPDYTNPRNMPLLLGDAHQSVNNSYMVFGADNQINHIKT
ncbi:MAG: hypothetical protein K2N56_07320, partial [Oscillospiraceae bacterium]|nr:hypothetical protein [Oscillospiraceae bacterium]